METGVRPLLLPEGHRAPRNRTCRRPKVLRARNSSSERPAPGLGSKTRELSPAPAHPCCWLGRGRDLGAHFRPRSGTTRAVASPAGVIRTAFQRRPRAGRRRVRPRLARPAPSPAASGPQCLSAATSSLLGRGPAQKHSLRPRNEGPTGVAQHLPQRPGARVLVRNVPLPLMARVPVADGAGRGAWRASLRPQRGAGPRRGS